MVFEIGKAYRHAGGLVMAIVGEVKTTMYGECLIGEMSDRAELRPISHHNDATTNWEEISWEEWQKNFFK